jgi:hypothetical protein
MSLLSGSGMAVCMLGLAVYLHVVPNGSKTALSNPQLSIIPLVLLLLYVVRDNHSYSHISESHYSCFYKLIPFRTNRWRER